MFACVFIRMGSLVKYASDRGLLHEKPKVDFSSEKTLHHDGYKKSSPEEYKPLLFFPVIAELGTPFSLPSFNPTLRSPALNKHLYARNMNSKGEDISSHIVDMPVNEIFALRKYVSEAAAGKIFMNMEPWESTEFNKDLHNDEKSSSNYIHKVIIGNDNITNVSQQGDLNQADVFIYGINNYISVDQEGTGNTAETETILDDNMIQIIQYGNWNFSKVLQSGYNNNVFIYQNSSN